MPLIYVSYAWLEARGQRPPWLVNLQTSLETHAKDAYKFYDPARPFLAQLQEMKDLLPAIPNMVNVLAPMFRAPVQLFLNVCKDVEEWDGYADYQHKTWCDLFFLLRADLVLVDLNIPTRNQQGMELTVAGVRGIPVISISDFDFNAPHALYSSSMVVPSTSPHLAEIVYKLVPPSKEESKAQEEKKEEKCEK